MSCYMCSERQLTVLATYAIRNALGDVVAYVASTGVTSRAIGQVFSMLAAANLASVEHRYPGQQDGAALYDAMQVQPSAIKETLPALTIIKLCHHYAYQACEHPAWEASQARALIDAIESHAVHHLPGYDDAPWGI